MTQSQQPGIEAAKNRDDIAWKWKRKKRCWKLVPACKITEDDISLPYNAIKDPRPTIRQLIELFSDNPFSDIPFKEHDEPFVEYKP